MSDIEDAAPEKEQASDDDDDLERELAAADGEDLEDEPALPSFRRRDEGSSKPKKQRQRRASPIEEDEPDDPEKARQWRLNKAIDEAIKGQKKKRKRLEGDDLASFHDDEMHRLREDMKLAAFQDIDAKKQGKPATAKLRMLPHVEEQLMRSSLADSILESNMLEAVRLWLEPLPDKSLPALNIQRALFTALEKLPVTSDHLRESGVGKVVYFYTLSNKRVEKSIARMADNLVSTWSRPIIKKSKSYRDRAVVEMEYRGRDDLSDISSSQVSAQVESDPHMRRKYAQHARIPQSVQAAYTVAPRSNISSQAHGSQFGPGGMGKDDRYKQISKRMAANKGRAGGLKPRVSVQGSH